METMQLQIPSLMNVKQPLSELLPLYTLEAWWIYQKVNEAERCGVAPLFLTFKRRFLRDKTNRKERAIPKAVHGEMCANVALSSSAVLN